ncbi:MAG: hypothetical protein EOP48_30770 [Sphingobacteriales bacterium]|nr:MAG: hypothetical protein EOP48_30770 [Sphingobacteriales bacterium]
MSKFVKTLNETHPKGCVWNNKELCRFFLPVPGTVWYTLDAYPLWNSAVDLILCCACKILELVLKKEMQKHG